MIPPLWDTGSGRDVDDGKDQILRDRFRHWDHPTPLDQEQESIGDQDRSPSLLYIGRTHRLAVRMVRKESRSHAINLIGPIELEMDGEGPDESRIGRELISRDRLTLSFVSFCAHSLRASLSASVS